MRTNEVVVEYFAWLVNIVNPNNCKGNYNRIFERFHCTAFEWELELDYNRYYDGLCLRDRFIAETCLNRAYTNCLDGSCSVLEMMVAMALRCEEEVMTDSRKGNRTDRWFWLMMEGMDLLDMTDNSYDIHYIDNCIDVMMNRLYSFDGSNGGMFKITNPRRDLRKVDLWCQLMWYLEENEDDDSDWLA